MKFLSKNAAFIYGTINAFITLLALILIYYYAQRSIWLLMIIVEVAGGSILIKHIKNMQKYITSDFLTGLGNKKHFSNQLEKQMALAKRNKQSFSILFMDIDNFKGINDIYGHVTGDKVLVNFSEILRKNVRSYDVVSRWGGDEFAVILMETDLFKVKRIVTRIQQSFQRIAFHYSCSVSIGFAVYDPRNPLTIEELMGEADKMLYNEKENRKKSYVNLGAVSLKGV